MKKFRNSAFYIGVIGGFSLLMYWIIDRGKDLEKGKTIITPQSGNGQWADFLTSFFENLHHPLAILLAQIVTIIMVARFFGWICIKIKQPVVIGEMIAGIVLGPSLIGMYFPEFSVALFPAESLSNLQFLSQIGLILFMYIVGMEIDMKILRNKAHDAVVISHASIIVPFVMGLGLAYYIYEEFAPSNVEFISFGLFAGIAMSITAFPVLARIVQERGLNKTKLGTVVITCAAADDITAWCILAAVIAIVKAGSLGSAVYTILLAIAYVVLMLKVVRPFLKRIGELYATRESLSKAIIAIFFLILILSSYITEIIGIHALFGAFVAGAIMPENINFRNIFIEKVEDVALVLLLPLFFVFTGLRTQIGLLDDPYLWKVAALIFVVAVIGKFASSALAARFVGQNWKDSLTIGALMNTRGLTELVALNIGYDLGVLSPELFSMMVIMALATTFMTGPALDFIDWIFKRKKTHTGTVIEDTGKYKILVAFSQAEYGKALLKLANSLTKKQPESSELTAMHALYVEDLHHIATEDSEKESFQAIFEEAKVLDRNITTLFKASYDVDSDIIEVANKEGGHDLLLIELGQSIYKGSLLGKVLGFTTRLINPEKVFNTVVGKENLFEQSIFDEGTQQLINRVDISVGMLINRKFTKAGAVFIPLFGPKDYSLLYYAKKLIYNNDSKIVFMDIIGKMKESYELELEITKMKQELPDHVTLMEHAAVGKNLLEQHDLMLISLEGWEYLINSKTVWLTNTPSVLIIKY